MKLQDRMAIAGRFSGSPLRQRREMVPVSALWSKHRAKVREGTQGCGLACSLSFH